MGITFFVSSQTPVLRCKLNPIIEKSIYSPALAAERAKTRRGLSYEDLQTLCLSVDSVHHSTFYLPLESRLTTRIYFLLLIMADTR